MCARLLLVAARAGSTETCEHTSLASWPARCGTQNEMKCGHHKEARAASPLWEFRHTPQTCPGLQFAGHPTFQSLACRWYLDRQSMGLGCSTQLCLGLRNASMTKKLRKGRQMSHLTLHTELPSALSLPSPTARQCSPSQRRSAAAQEMHECVAGDA